MVEKDFNKLIADSLEASYKIPDPQGKEVFTSAKRPFDGIGAYKGKAIYWEAKLKKSFSSFNLQDIRDHQIENLCAFKKALPDSFCCIILGIIEGKTKKSLQVYVFDDVFEVAKRREAKENYKKEELLTIPYIKLIDNKLELF